MGSIVNQSSKGLIANFIGIILGFLNVMLIMPAILKPEQIGLINLVLSVVFVLYPVMDFSASSLLGRYFANFEKKQQMLQLSFAVSAFGALIFVPLLFLGRPLFEAYYLENSPAVLPYFWWIYAVSLLMSWLGLLETFSIIHQRMHVSVFVKEVIFRCLITCLLGALSLKWLGFDTYFYLHFLMYGICAILIFIYLKYRGLIVWGVEWPEIGAGLRRSMLRYGGFVLFNGMATVVSIRIDLIMLGAMEGLKDVGIYTMAAFMSTFIDTPRRMVVMSASPIIRMAMKENDLENMAKIQRKSISNLVLIAGFMLMMVMINLKDFYLLIPKGEIYGQGLSVVFFLGLAKMSEMLVGANYEVFMGSRYYYLNTFFVLMLAGLTILFNYIFIPIDGMTGAAYATLLSTSCVCLSRAGAFYYLFRINVYDIKILWMLIFFSLSGVVMFMAPMLVHPIISMGIKSLVGAVLMYIFLRVSKISPDLNTLINNVLEKIPVVGFLKL